MNARSETTHPGAFPPGAHFSWMGGGTHAATVSFWDVGVSGLALRDGADGSNEVVVDLRPLDGGTAGAWLGGCL